MALEDERKIDHSEFGEQSVEQNFENSTESSAERPETPNFGMPSEMGDDESIDQVQKIDEIPAEESAISTHQDNNTEMISQEVIQKRVEDLLNGNVQIPINGGNTGSEMDQILGMSADHTSQLE